MLQIAQIVKFDKNSLTKSAVVAVAQSIEDSKKVPKGGATSMTTWDRIPAVADVVKIATSK